MKKVWIFGVSLVGLVLLGALTAAQLQSKGQSEIQQGLAIAPLPLNLAGKNHALVARGSYIVNAQGGCVDCHTNPWFSAGGNPFLGEPEQVNVGGYLLGGTSFGPFISRNIRPNSVTGLPANLTFEQFREVLRKGTDFHDAVNPLPGTPLLQVMPWPVFTNMKDQDILAIYEYLRSLPPSP